MLRILHGRVGLALHVLAESEGPALLLLHELGGSSQDWSGIELEWSGSIYGLDLSGHGASEWISGGSYSPELYAGDADAALRRIGPAALAGAGIGAYVALLLASARNDRVPAALMLPGRGLRGSGGPPDFAGGDSSFGFDLRERVGGDPFDPMVLSLERDPRPREYAAGIARDARRLLLPVIADPPPWWSVVAAQPNAEIVPAGRAEALRRLERACGIAR